MNPIAPPFPYFGGKGRAASLVWPRFGTVGNYVEPFAGSLAMLLRRPDPTGVETVNDKDGFIANFWRETQADPEAVAFHADHPVNENDLHARHSWLVREGASIVERLEGDPAFFDAKVAGWWCWGLCCWIGSGWCSGKGPWNVVEGRLVKAAHAGQGVNRQSPHLGDAGRGVNRQRLHLGDAGRGVNRKLPHLGDAGRGDLVAYFQAIRDRIRNVRVCCGDWSRVCGDTPLFPVGRGNANARTAVFLDPPYADTAQRDGSLYRKEDLSVAHAVREWAIERGDDPRLRIALCGYEGEHVMPASWTVTGIAANGHGYGGRKAGGYANAKRERVWFSPHCLPVIEAARPESTLFAC